MREAVLVHLAAGLGNIVLATPLLVALRRLGYTVDLWLSADYAETSDLFRGWATIRDLVDGPAGDYAARIPAVPPFYWAAFETRYAGVAHVARRPPNALFWSDEQGFYLEFARRLGYSGPPPLPCLPVVPHEHAPCGSTTVVLAPGCKTGEMAAKRWPWYPELAARLADVVVVGTPDDLWCGDRRAMVFPPHVRNMCGRLGLRETAELMASAGVVVANDSGLGHLAATLGVPTILLFGPTPHHTLGRMPPNVKVLRTALACQPCWFTDQRFKACARRIDCLKALGPADVAGVVQQALAGTSAA